jgi:hyperosmotically inducible protein
MITRISLALLLLFALASVCLAKDPISDDLISDQVRLKLANDQIVKGGALKVDVKNGVVSLAGQVELPKQKERATKVAKKIKGVKDVVNNITIRDQNAHK